MTHTIDAFNNGSGASLAGRTPTGGGSTWARLGGADADVVVNTGTNVQIVNATDALFYVAVGSNDMTAEITTGDNIASASNLNPCVRASDQNNYFGALIQSTTSVDVYKRVSGSLTNLGTITVSPAMSFGTTKLKLGIQGNTLTLYRDGVSQGTIDVTGSGVPTGTNAGLNNHSGTITFWVKSWDSDVIAATGMGALLSDRRNVLIGGGLVLA